MTTRRTGCCIAVRFEPDWPAEELPDFARWVEELGFEELWFARIPARVVDDHSGVLGQRVLHRAASPCRSARPRCAGSAAAAPAGLRGVDTLFWRPRNPPPAVGIKGSFVVVEQVWTVGEHALSRESARTDSHIQLISVSACRSSPSAISAWWMVCCDHCSSRHFNSAGTHRCGFSSDLN